MSEVAITGVGTVGSYGCGVAALEAALRDGSPRLAEVDRSAGYHLPASARRAALVAPEDVARGVPAGAARRMSVPSRLASVATALALADAGLAVPLDDADTAVVSATSFGPAAFTERLLRSVVTEGPESASPMLFTECVANAPAGQVAIACGARGPNVTVVQREAGPLIALGLAAAEVAAGRARRALVIAVDELPPLVHALLDRFHALSRATRGRDERALPFDRARNGVIAAEGATVLVLEDAAAARERGATVRALVAGAGRGFDPSATRANFGTGAPALARGLARLLRRCEQDPATIDRIVSGASGAIAGDLLEAQVLRAAWDGAILPPVLAPKAVTGEYAGGFLAAAVLAVAGVALGAPPAGGEPDAACGVVPFSGGALGPARSVLVSSLAAGGGAAWVLLARVR